MLLEILLGALTALLVWDYLYKRVQNNILKQSGFMGPKCWPIIGGALHFFNQNQETIFNLVDGFLTKYGKTYKMWIMHENNLLTYDAKLMEGVLSNQQLISKNLIYSALKSWLGNGLLLSTGKKWHQRRKIITPTFHFKILEQFVEVFDQQSAIMTKRLHEFADGKTVVNVFPYVCLSALDIVAETAMGVKVNAQCDPNFGYAKAVTDAAQGIAVRLMRPSQRFDFLMAVTAPLEYQKLTKSIKYMHNFTDQVIKERRLLLQKSIADGTYEPFNASDDVGSKRRMALLDVLLQSTIGDSPMSNEDIREEVDTFMFEGHDTTTSGISFTLYLLSRHAEIQRKVFEEIRAVVGNDKYKPIGLSELSELKYLECVIKESMRLYPPVPMIGRYVNEDTIINGKLLPKGLNIIILIYKAARDADYFENPDSFIPERFLNDKIDPFAYVPFSAGPRNCIGQKFALLEMKSTISKMIRHFELLPLGEEIRPLMNLILRSSTGMQVGLIERQYF